MDENDPRAFQRVELAVAAASSGDTILVRPGTYIPDLVSHPAAVVDIDVGLTLVGDVGGEAIIPAVRVHDLAAGELVVLRNLTITGTFASGFMLLRNPGIEITDAAGTVLVEDCTVTGSGGALTGPIFQFVALPGWPGLTLTNADAVVVSRCTLTGGDGFTTPDAFPYPLVSTGGAGLEVTGGRVAVYHSTLVGGDGGTESFHPEPSAPGGAGLLAVDADVRVMGATLHGGAGGDGCTVPDASACRGGAGLELHGASIARAVGATLAGGAGGVLVDLTPAPDGADALTNGNPFADYADVVSDLSTPATVRPGEPVALTVSGDPGETVTLFVSVDALFVALGGKRGVFVPAEPFITVALGAIPGGGEIAIAPLAPDLGLDALPVVLQAYTLAGPGDVVLGNPDVLVMLGAGW